MFTGIFKNLTHNPRNKYAQKKGIMLKKPMHNPRNKYTQKEGISLGLTPLQVLEPNFDWHTIDAIKAETEGGMGLEEAFLKYKGLKHIQIDGMIRLGLDRSQVLSENFSCHTINAIEAEITREEAPLSLNDAFAKYCDLGVAQIDGMTKIGLSRKQVLSPNFGPHTNKAIKDIQKRTKGLPTAEAFEMVKGKSCGDTKEFLKSYLESTKKKQKPVDEMDLIRVVANIGRGFGHQRATITLMQKIREMGFKGTFDIQCNDKLNAKIFRTTKASSMYWNTEPLVSRQLKIMMPDFESAEAGADGVKVVSGLGAVKISSLPFGYETRDDFALPKADLAVCAADDNIPLQLDTTIKTFNASSYIGLEPTDWHLGRCFVVDHDGVATSLPEASETRLSSDATYQLPDISSIPLSDVESIVVEITYNTDINSQLIYGLYPDKKVDIERGGMKESGNLDEATEMQRVVEANFALSKKTGKPAILLLPQKIALDDSFIRKVQGENPNVHFIDLIKDYLDVDYYKAGDVVVAHTGCLQQMAFEYLMLEGTTLPPVIEGCNSMEACESAGRPFIHGSYRNLKQYKVGSSEKQALHTTASLCLEQGDPKYIPQLVQYMEESLTLNPNLLAYHKERRAAFFARPDATELAFDALGIAYAKSTEIEEDVKLEETGAAVARLEAEELAGGGEVFRGREICTELKPKNSRWI